MIGWFIVPYKRRRYLVEPGEPDILLRPTRYCAMYDAAKQIRALGGQCQWSETEILGNRAIVKVRTSQAALDALDQLFRRLPKDRLDDSLADLSPAVLARIRDEILDMGYPLAEIRDRFGDDLSIYTLRDVLRFMARRRLKPRYDAGSDEIVCDGAVQPVKSVENVDSRITEN